MAVLEIRGPGSDERAESGLRRAVDAEGGRTFHARDRAVENDRATIIHEREGLLYREQRSLNIDIEEFVEMLLRDLSHGSKFSDPGVGENDIDSPLRFDGFVETIKVGQFGNVSARCCCDAPGRVSG